MNRETKTIVCPSGKEAILKAYLTAGERRQLRNVYADSLQAPATPGEKPQLTSLGSTIAKAEDMLINLVVESYAGSTENILGCLLDGNPADGNDKDYDFLLEEANKLNDVFTKAK